VFKGLRQWTLSRLHFHGLTLHTLMLFPSMHILPSCILPLNSSIKILDTSHYHACYIVRLFDPFNHVTAEYAAPRHAQSVTSTVLANTFPFLNTRHHQIDLLGSHINLGHHSLPSTFFRYDRSQSFTQSLVSRQLTNAVDKVPFNRPTNARY